MPWRGTITAAHGFELRLGQWVYLLQPYQRHILAVVLDLFFAEVEIHLAHAQYHLFHLRRVFDKRVVHHFPEPTVRELRHGGIGPGVAQVGLGREIDEGFAELPLQLPAQGVEEVGCRGDIGDYQVVLGTHLQEAFHAGAGVLGTAAFIAVWQQQHDAVHVGPFLLGSHNVLVDNGLGTIGEVAVLGLPQHQVVGVGHGVTIFKAQYPKLTQQRVVDIERSLLGVNARQAVVGFVGHFVVNDGVAVGEGATLHVLRSAARHRPAARP